MPPELAAFAAAARTIGDELLVDEIVAFAHYGECVGDVEPDPGMRACNQIMILACLELSISISEETSNAEMHRRAATVTPWFGEDDDARFEYLIRLASRKLARMCAVAVERAIPA